MAVAVHLYFTLLFETSVLKVVDSKSVDDADVYMYLSSNV
jgi:hypothetical protein